MDVFTQLEDTVGEFYSSSFTNSADHSLQSPDMSALATSPQSIFMYEHDSEPVPHSKPSIDNNNTRGDRMDYVSDPLANPLFEAPCWPDEMANFGVDDLTDSFMSESSLCGSSFNDSVKDSVWDFAGYDDVSSPLQHPEDDFLHSPTLAELNMDDTHDVFGGGNQQHSAFSQTTQLHTKTKPVLIKQSSHKHGHHVRQQERSSSLRRKAQASSATRDHKYSSLFTVAAKSNPLPTNSLHHKKSHHDQIRPESSCNDLTMVETLQAESSGSAGSSRTNCLSFTNLLGRRTRTFATSLPTMRQQRSPLLEDAKIIVKMEPRDGVDVVDESSVDRKWEEIKSFIHQDVMNKTTMVKNEEAGGDETSVTEGSPTKLTLKKHAHGYSVKSEKKDFSSSIQTRDDGFDSHDEGLGSEHDDMEEVSEDEDDGRMEDDEASDLSDVEEEPGLSSSSMQAAAGKYRTKSRRSEYDDMTPNPRKLLHIGNELRKLNKIISDMAPVSELSGSARNRCRKEKNKLASRACRLKKKAQHEANKIKLSGLEDESTRLMVVLTAIKKDMVQKVRRPHIQFDGNLTQILDDLIKNNLGQMVAGHTNEYVNRVMERTAREKSVNLKSTIDS